MSAPPRFERIVFFGTPEFALAALVALDAADRRPVAVVSQPARRAGRGGRLAEPPVACWAMRHGVELLQPERIRSREFLERIRACSPDVAVVAAYGRIFPAALLDLPPAGCINVHASLLPAWRGASPIQATIAAGEEVTGVTTMLMEEGLDTGPILMQQEVAIGPQETAGELSSRLAAKGGDLLVRTLDGLEAGVVEPRPQRHDDASHAPMLRVEDAVVDWTLPARDIGWRVRAHQPWPGARTRLRGETVRIIAARPALPSPAPGGGEEPGAFLGCSKVAEVGRTALVRCGEGSALALERVQRPGRRAVGGADLVNGLRLQVGERLGCSG